MTVNPYIALEQKYCAKNYSPLPIVLVKGKGVRVWDDQGKAYLDMMSAYSAVSQGHCHPRIMKAVQNQLKKVSIVSRAYHSDTLGAFLEKICTMTHYEAGLPMNSGAEAVETSLKVAKKWAYKVKGVPEGKAEVISAIGNFHGRTIGIVGLSSEPQYKDGFGPYPEGYKLVPYGDAEALEKAITPHTACFIVEPIQGEAGIVVPPAGYLKACSDICKRHNVLLICDEIQSGLGRSGKLLASSHEGVRPDAIVLGKSLGGGVLPISIFLADRHIMDVITPGDHGSTFGGNSLAAAVGLEALKVIEEEGLIENSEKLGAYFIAELKKVKHPAIKEVRGKGLFIGIEIDPAYEKARNICLAMMAKGVLSKETHGTIIRFAPALVVTKAQLNKALSVFKAVMKTIPTKKPS